MQPGFFDFDNLNDKLDQHNDPLAKINELVDWAAFRPFLSKIRMPRSSNKGHPRSDTLLMFKMIFLRQLTNTLQIRGLSCRWLWSDPLVITTTGNAKPPAQIHHAKAMMMFAYESVSFFSFSARNRCHFFTRSGPFFRRSFSRLSLRSSLDSVDLPGTVFFVLLTVGFTVFDGGREGFNRPSRYSFRHRDSMKGEMSKRVATSCT